MCQKPIITLNNLILGESCSQENINTAASEVITKSRRKSFILNDSNNNFSHATLTADEMLKNFPPSTHAKTPENNINQKPSSACPELHIFVDLSPIPPLTNIKQDLSLQSHGEPNHQFGQPHGELSSSTSTYTNITSPNHPKPDNISHTLNNTNQYISHLRRDTDNNPPPSDLRFNHLLNLYQAYQNHPTNETRITLTWLNLLRGLLNNSSWTLAWVHLMSISLTENQTSERSITIMNHLRSQPILLLPPPRTLNKTPFYNWFPLVPRVDLAENLREIHKPPNPAHIELEAQGSVVHKK